MTKKEPIRFAIDANVACNLALAVLEPKEKFFYYIKTTEETYEGLLWLDKLLQSGRIELVLPHTVHTELIKSPNSLTHEQQKHMMPDKLTNYKRNQYYKKLVNKYTKKREGIKSAYVASQRDIKLYMDKSSMMAEFYSEEPKFPSRELSERAKTKPFLMDGFYACSDARIMAQATMLGLDLVTFDHHLVGRYPFNIPETIQKINQETFLSSARPYRFKDFIAMIKRDESNMPYISKSYKHPSHPCLAPTFELLSRTEYVKRVQEKMEEKQAMKFELKDIAAFRTLFTKYMTEPLDTNSLTYTEELLAHKQALLEKQMKAELEKIAKEKKKTLSSEQQTKPALISKQKTTTSRVKIDLNSPNAMQALEKFTSTKNQERNY